MKMMRKNRFTFWVGVLAGCMALITFATLSPAHAQEHRSALPPTAVPRTGGGFPITTTKPAIEVELGALPQMTTKEIAAYPQHELRPNDGMSDEEYYSRKKLVRDLALSGLTGAKSHWLGANLQPGSASPLAAQNGAVRPPSVGFFQGFFAQQELCSGCNWPPDMALAVGTNFVLQVVNTQIAVYDKNGNLAPGFPKSANTFFNLAAGTYTTDPRAFYDWANHRFVVVMLTESNPFTGSGNVGGLLIAASAGQDPRGTWHVYNPAFNIGNAGECPDFPTLGHDSNNWGTGATKGGVYVGINQFGGSGICKGSGFIGNYFFMIAKDALYSGGGLSWWTQVNFSDGPLVDTLAPANMTDWADRPSSVFIANTLNINFGGSQNTLVVWSVSNPFGWIGGGASPTFGGVNMTTAHSYDYPPGADTPNGAGGVCSQCLDTDDRRISGQLKYHAGHLFGSFNTAVSGSSEAGLIWFDVHPVLDGNGNITTADERQEDCFVCGGWASNGSAYYGIVQPDPENNLLLAFNFSSDAAYGSLVYTSRRVNYLDSNMDGVGNFLVQGTAFYQQGCNGSGQFCRWGDYTASAPDLTIATHPSMWFSGEYANSSANWGTAIAAVRYLLPTDE